MDDTPENIHILMAFLRLQCEVTAATCGQKALQCARSNPQPDLILLDVIMPGMSGYKVCEQLKADPQTAHIPVIFVTGMTDEEDEDKGLKLGAADYITKPFRAGTVRARVKHHLELKLQRDALSSTPSPSSTLPLLESALGRSAWVPYLRCDSQGMILACSPAFCDLLGLSQHVVGRELWPMLPAVQATSLRQAVAAGGEQTALQSWPLPQRESWRFQLTSDAQGFLLLGEQVDQASLESTTDRWLTQEAARLKSEFLANLSHEIRSPLHAISGMAHLLGETALDPRQWEFLRDLESGVGQLRKVVADLLEFADADLSLLELRPQEFQLRGLVDGVILQLAARAQQKEVELVSRLAADLPDLVWGDSARLGQLLLALLDNGIKFAAGGRVSLSVERLDDRHLQFKILDSGIGMTGEQRAHLLGDYAVANAGMGLPMSRRIVERMRGSFRLESQPGQGTLITLELPLLQRIEPNHQSDPVRLGGPGQKVLLVEDNEINQRIVAEMFLQAGIGVEVAANGRIALEKVQQCGPEIPWRVILMDLQMPEMDGYTAARSIRQQARFQQVPILAMSSHVLGEERDRCREAGMDDFVFKPVDRESWFATLGRWLPLENFLKTDAFPELSLVNSAFGMRSCGGNQKFYKSLLLDFAERCRHSVWELETALAHGDFGRIRFITHTLHGVAANLGAEELARQCQLLQEKPESDWPQALSTMVAYLQLLAETLPAELTPSAPDLPPEEWTPQRAQATRKAIAALSQLLIQGLGESLDSVQDLMAVATPLTGQMEELERRVNQFNFSGALQELARLEAGIPGN
ncbi:MAG: response regulator [Candidatus Eremiobacteraeota bacterium]|nr:response regulator [Candidatus Eremiobacteraeota bacterium]